MITEGDGGWGSAPSSIWPKRRWYNYVSSY